MKKEKDIERQIVGDILAFKCYETMKAIIECDFGGYDKFKSLFKNNYHEKSIDLTKLSPECESFDETHPLYGKVCVFTGILEQFTREQAAQIVVNLGGQCGNTVTKKTNFLILGNNDYCSAIKDGKSTKQKKPKHINSRGRILKLSPKAYFTK